MRADSTTKTAGAFGLYSDEELDEQFVERIRRDDADEDVTDPRELPPAQKCVRFGVGQLHVTPRAQAALAATKQRLNVFIHRHACGKWGETRFDEREENHRAIREGRGVLSMHTLNDGSPLWAATEADRSRTTFFLPSEV
ncbi:MAG: hypothetical protein WCD76_21325 [Pyrinomonadaceae bacterium]